MKSISYFKKLQIDSLVSLLWRLVTRIQIPARLNHRKVKKAEPVTYLAQICGGAKYFDFKRRVFGLIQYFSKHKMKRYARSLEGDHVSPAEIITIRFAGWISGRIVSLQPDADIQKLVSNGNRIRISETLLSMFRGFRLLEKVAHCTIIHLLSSEASFQPSVPWLPVCLWCNLCTVM